MKKFSDDDFKLEAVSLHEEIEVLEKKLDELRDLARSSGVSPWESEECKACEGEIREKRELVNAIEGFLGHVGYDRFEKGLTPVENYLKEKYQDEIELPPFLAKRRALLLKECPPIEIKCYEEGLGILEEDLREEKYEEAVSYFKTKKRGFVYSWELKFLLPILQMENIEERDIVNDLFPDSSEEAGDPEAKELEENFRFVLTEFENKKKLHLSLYLWTFYKTYHLLRKLDTDFIFPRYTFPLIKALLKVAESFYWSMPYDWDLVDKVKKPLPRGDDCFLALACSESASDLIYTIVRCFPGYYSRVIMYLGWDLHTPGGCESLTADMTTFEGFLNDIGDYDFWVDEFTDGKKVLEKKVKIKKKYEEARKKVTCC